MNIFILSLCVFRSADMYLWKHCIKIILEICQMMSSYLTPSELQLSRDHGIEPYKPTHARHPMTLWVNRSMNNYLWAGNMALALCQRYTDRYGKDHACEYRIRWLMNHVERPYVEGTLLSTCGHAACMYMLTPIPQCMPDEYKVDEDDTACVVSPSGTPLDAVVRAYRNYYVLKRNTIRDT